MLITKENSQSLAKSSSRLNLINPSSVSDKTALTPSVGELISSEKAVLMQEDHLEKA